MCVFVYVHALGGGATRLRTPRQRVKTDMHTHNHGHTLPESRIKPEGGNEGGDRARGRAHVFDLFRLERLPAVNSTRCFVYRQVIADRGPAALKADRRRHFARCGGCLPF